MSLEVSPELRKAVDEAAGAVTPLDKEVAEG